MRPFRLIVSISAGLALLTAIAVVGPMVAAAPGPVRAAPADMRSSRASGPSRIVVIVMENEEQGGIIGSSSAPYLNGLARRSVSLTHEYAIRHPSLPNYLALIGGSTFGVTSDCTTCYVGRRNLIDQLEAGGISWRAYMQGMPRPCYTDAFAGASPHQYAKKHDPFLYFDDIRTDPARCHRVVPFTRLGHDLNRGLPRFTWITPDLCSDMHSCPVSTGDRFLRRWVPRLIPRLGPDGILMVLFDEGSSNAGCCPMTTGGGHVAAIIAGPGAKSGRRIGRRVNHYSLLRLIEDAWGLGRLAHASDAGTPTISGWRA
jgi:phosphatidylinositol-3-phosphatase